MILVDTSAWIEGIRRTESAVDLKLVALQAAEADLAVTEPIILELLSGARSARELIATRRRLLAFPMLRVGGLETYERAAAVWRTCRAAGEPVRTTMDCLVAAVAIREGATILHQDRDFDTIGRHTELQVEPVEPSV